MTEIRDVYSRITGKIIADLEQGIRPWHRPWNADHAAGRITRPLRHNGIPYKGINVVMLWSAAMTKGYACPLWLTFKQAIELGGHVRKGEAGELVVYANSITRTETDAKGEETEREIPYMKGYTVFNAEQCDGLPAHYTAAGCPGAQARVPKVTVGSFRSCECRGHGGWEIRIRRKRMYRAGAVRKMNLACALAYLPFFTLLGGAAAWPMLKTLLLSVWDVGLFLFHASAFTVRMPPRVPAQPTVFVTAVAVKPIQSTSDQWA
jgi:hypothetical protein